MRAARMLGVALALSFPALSVGEAQGHGPVYGLATPTLGKGGWSLDLGAMSRFVGATRSVMLRPMLTYGITEDLQISGSFPMPLYTPLGIRSAHGMSRMPTNPDIEFLLGWRFHRQGIGIGSRFESTAYVGFDYPTDAVRAGVRTAPGLYAAAVTGYASRSVYLWAGGLYRRYMTPSGSTADHPGDAAMYSLVIGYRPAMFRKELPHSDWRIFLEAFGEWTGVDVVGGVRQPDTGAHQIFAGPTLLGLFGSWGISGGPVFPLLRRLKGSQPREKARLAVITTFWF